MGSNFKIKTENGENITVGPNCFLIFIDETGDESLNDPNYPVFGLGGCGILANRYYQEIIVPWNNFKDKHFEGRDTPLHASDLKKLTPDQIEHLNNFFIKGNFTRIATVISDRTIIKTEVKKYDVIAISLSNRIRDVAQWIPVDSIALIFEQSTKGDKLAKEIFDKCSVTAETNGQIVKIPIYKFRMFKQNNEPGLEIADLIIHAAGTFTRGKLQGKYSWENNRRDVECIFKIPDRKLTSYLEISEAVSH